MQIHVGRGRGENMISVQSLECPVPQCLGAGVACSWGICCPKKSSQGYQGDIAAPSKKHVLVAGTDSSSLAYQKELLETAGYEVTCVYGYNQALSALTSSTKYDFVLSGALYLEKFYLTAITKYGKGKVIVYTALEELATNLNESGVQAFFKSEQSDRHPLGRGSEELIKEIGRLLQA